VQGAAGRRRGVLKVHVHLLLIWCAATESIALPVIISLDFIFFEFGEWGLNFRLTYLTLVMVRTVLIVGHSDD